MDARPWHCDALIDNIACRRAPWVLKSMAADMKRISHVATHGLTYGSGPLTHRTRLYWYNCVWEHITHLCQHESAVGTARRWKVWQDVITWVGWEPIQHALLPQFSIAVPSVMNYCPQNSSLGQTVPQVSCG